MKEFFLSTRISKILGSSEYEIEMQLETLEQIIKQISNIDPIFENWYVNNSNISTIKPPLDYPFPSEKAKNYLFNLRKSDNLDSFLLWNGIEERSQYVSFNFDSFGLIMTFKKILEIEQIVRIFKIFLSLLKFEYIYLNSYFFGDINIFPHRLETTPICYVPKKIEDGDIPHLYKKIDINNELNQGTILVFDQNLFDESDEMKKKVQENSVALVDMGLIPEAELDADFFTEN